MRVSFAFFAALSIRVRIFASNRILIGFAPFGFRPGRFFAAVCVFSRIPNAITLRRYVNRTLKRRYDFA